MNTTFPLRIFAKTRRLLLFADLVLLIICGANIYLAETVLSQLDLFPATFLLLLKSSGVFGLIFFACGLVVALQLWFRPALIVDEKGIVDNGSGTSVGRIPWSNIAEVRPVSFVGLSYIGIIPNNLDELMRHCGILTRMSIKRRIRMGYPPIIIPTAILDINSTQLVGEIHAFQDTLK